MALIVWLVFSRERVKNARGKSLKKSRDWILEKKERRRRQGRSVLIVHWSVAGHNMTFKKEHV